MISIKRGPRGKKRFLFPIFPYRFHGNVSFWICSRIIVSKCQFQLQTSLIDVFFGKILLKTPRSLPIWLGKHMFFCGGQASSVSGVEYLTHVLPTESIQNWIRVNLHMDHPIDQESRGRPLCFFWTNSWIFLYFFPHQNLLYTNCITCIMPYNLYKTNAIILWSSFCKCDFHFAVFRLIWQPQQNLGGFWAQHPTWGSKQKSKVITSLLCDLRQDQFLSYRNQPFLEFYD